MHSSSGTVFLSCCTNGMVLNVLYNIEIYMGMAGQSLEGGPIYISMRKMKMKARRCGFGRGQGCRY